MKKVTQSESDTLRQRAEALFSQQVEKSIAQLSEVEIYKLFHELEVHQIELQLQNEELIQAREEAIVASDKYIELYDFAPSGYFTLSQKGEILQLNLIGAKMLGKDRSQLINRLFQLHLSDNSKPAFLNFMKQIFASITNQSCELALVTDYDSPAYLHLDGILSESGDHCYVTTTDITHRKQAEENLRRANEFDQTLLKTIPFGMEIVDESGNILYLSEGFRQLLGEDIGGKKCWELCRDDQKQCDDCPLHTGIKVGLTETIEIHGVLGGKIFEVSHTGMIYNGQKAMLEIFVDISKRKQVENALQESEEKYRTLSENSPAVIYRILLQPSFKYDYVSPIVTEITGYTPEEHYADPDLNFKMVHPDDRSILENSKHKTAGEPIVLRWVRKDGKTIWTEQRNVLILDKAGKPFAVEGVATDITTQKLAEKELAFQADMLSQISEAVVTTDVDGAITFWNNSAEKLYGWKSEEVIGKSLLEVIPSSITKAQVAEIFDLLTKGQNWIGEVTVINRTGDSFPVIVNDSPMFDANHKLTGVIGISSDITERKKNVEALIAAKQKAEESDSLKSAFLANMSHEIRTPMNGILGFASLLQESDLTGEEQQEYIEIILKSGARMLNILSEVVDISKIESGTMETHIREVNINKKIESVYEILKPEAEIKALNLFVNKSSQVMDLVIETDGEKLEAILLNLIKNAIKYTNQGAIEFGYNPMEIDGSYVLQFYVQDTGIGINKDRQEAIFERFIQAEISDIEARQGAGLGLAIVKSYVEMLGGKVWVESEKGVGSIFYFTLPYQVKPTEKIVLHGASPSDKADSQIHSPISELKILIVEDDETSTIYLSAIIKTISNNVLYASSGIEAVEICKCNPDIKLVLMDIQMPKMNGYEAARQIRKFNKEVVIIAQTAFAMAGDREKAIEIGCNDYISKPINKNDLLSLILKYCKR